jgi:hypothetical protein
MLDALNSGDRETLVEYAATYAPAGSTDVEGLIQSASQMGELRVVDTWRFLPAKPW